MILSMSNLGHDYGNEILLSGLSTAVDKADRIVLMGKNGCGKTTLLRILSGQLVPAIGELFVSSDLRIGFQRQERVTDTEMELFDYYLQDKKYVIKDTVEYYSYERRVRSILSGLGFTDEDWNRKLASFSGGELTRIALGKLLLLDYDLLLLDEPTNHLDLQSVDWLMNFLKNYNGAVILVSHDRYLVRNVGNRFWEFNGGEIWNFKGNYTKYLESREIMMKTGERTKENIEKEIKHLEEVSRRYRNWGQEKFIKQAKSKEKQIEKLKSKMNQVSLPDEEINDPRIRLPEPDRTGYKVLEVKNLNFSFDQKDIFNNTSLLVHRKEKVGLLGPNGSGKSTFLKLLVGELKKQSGEVKWGHNVRFGYLSQMTEELDPESEVIDECWKFVWHWPDYKVRKYLGRFDFTGEDVFKKVSSISGGEKTKLALAKLILKKPNVLIMDEPTNNLDIWAVQSLETVLKEYESAMIIVSHDREFLKNICDKYVAVHNKEIINIPSLDYYLKGKLTYKLEKEEKDDSTTEQLSYEERKKIRNIKKSLIRKYEKLENNEKALENRLGEIQYEMRSHPREYEKLHELQKEQKTIEDKLLNLLEEKEKVSNEINELVHNERR
ncbi:MAG: ATP-binding cassette domain-containing protein [Thermotogota bacterium]|nr:ATP-binding cassette domain-containing protein [Thermotogota bacterium]